MSLYCYSLVGKNQSEFSRRTQIPQSSVSGWRSGDHNVTWGELARIAAAGVKPLHDIFAEVARLLAQAHLDEIARGPAPDVQPKLQRERLKKKAAEAPAPKLQRERLLGVSEGRRSLPRHRPRGSRAGHPAKPPARPEEHHEGSAANNDETD